MREQKFIIARVKGKLRHFVGTKGWSGEDHLIIARHNNISEIDIVEKGFLIDRTIEVWECYDKKHLHKIKTKTPDKWLGYDIEDYEKTLRKEHWLK